ncbi:MAG: hypothetical protein OXF02_05620 [Simkaniaceae bacterium]|nr:hypothetical protein [Simkaniaceae bacterium]
MSYMLCCAARREPTPPPVVDTTHDYEAVVRQPAVSMVDTDNNRMNAISRRMDTISDRIDIISNLVDRMSNRLDDRIDKLSLEITEIKGMFRTFTDKLTEESVGEVPEVAEEREREKPEEIDRGIEQVLCKEMYPGGDVSPVSEARPDRK